MTMLAHSGIIAALAIGLAAGAAAADPAPAATPAEGPETAVLNPIKALRANDLAALLARLDEARRKDLAASWTRFAERRNRFLDERLDAQIQPLLADGAADQFATSWASSLALVKKEELAKQITDFAHPQPRTRGEAPPEGRPPRPPLWQPLVGEAMAVILAQGLESRQVEVVQLVLDSAAAWATSAPLAEPERVKTAATAFVDAFKQLGVTKAADLTAIDLNGAAQRLGKALARLKAVSAAFGVDLDAALDSVKVAEVNNAPGSPGAKILTVTFTLFGKEQRLPVKAIQVEGRWQVSADSPLGEWMGQRMPGGLLFGIIGGGMRAGGPPFGGGQGRGGRGRRGGQGGDGEAPPPPPPPPEGAAPRGF